MANWKKVVVSGSQAELRNITASGNISASGYIKTTNFDSYNSSNVMSSITAAGTDNSDATSLGTVPTGRCVVIGADGTKGVILPRSTDVGDGFTFTVHNLQNGGSSNLKLWPYSGDKIIPLAADANATLPANTAIVLTRQSEGIWMGYLTTVIS